MKISFNCLDHILCAENYKLCAKTMRHHALEKKITRYTCRADLASIIQALGLADILFILILMVLYYNLRHDYKFHNIETG